jgi:hypothetical protein
MHRSLRPFIALVLFATLLAAPGLALAHGEGPQQTVDGYTVTLALPDKGFFTGRNPLAVSLWDWQGKTPEATVSVLLLAYTPPSDGHGDTHGEAAAADDHGAADDHAAAAAAHATADDHAATDGHAATDNHATDDAHSAADDHAATNDQAAAAAEHAHDDAGAVEGRGLAVAPVALAASEELGEYRGEVVFDEAGTYTVSVIFTIDGEERGAIFDVAVAQSRPRGLVLGGFALVNALAIGSAAFLRWRGPAKAARKPARPATAQPSVEEQPK